MNIIQRTREIIIMLFFYIFLDKLFTFGKIIVDRVSFKLSRQIALVVRIQLLRLFSLIQNKHLTNRIRAFPDFPGLRKIAGLLFIVYSISVFDTPNELRFGSSLSNSFSIKNTEQNSAIKSSNYYKKILYHQKSINFDFGAFLFFKNGLNTGQNSILQTFVQSLQNRVPRVQVLLPLP